MNNKKWLSFLLVIVGNIIYALSVKLFLLPSNLISCGTTGMALVVEHLLHIPMSGFILMFNVVMLLVGWWILGRQFAMSTLFSSLFYPIALEVLNRTLGDVRITDDALHHQVVGYSCADTAGSDNGNFTHVPRPFLHGMHFIPYLSIIIYRFLRFVKQNLETHFQFVLFGSFLTANCRRSCSICPANYRGHFDRKKKSPTAKAVGLWGKWL